MKLDFDWLLLIVLVILVGCQKKEDVIIENIKSDSMQNSYDYEPSNGLTKSELKDDTNRTNISIEKESDSIIINIPKSKKIDINSTLEKIRVQQIDLDRNKKIDFLIFYKAVRKFDTTYFFSVYLNNNDKLEDIFYYQMPKNLARIENIEYGNDHILSIKYLVKNNNIGTTIKFQFGDNKIYRIN